MSGGRVKNFRRRSDGRDANGEEKSTTAPAASTATSTTSRSQTLSLTKPKSSKLENSKPEGPKRLSFADDEEEEGVATAAPRQPSKPVPSIHKLSSAKERSKISSLAPSIPSNVQPQAGEYTKERLLELQKNARPLGSMPRPKPAPSFSEPPKPQKTDPPAEPVIILKGLVKPASTTTPGQEGEKGAAWKLRDEEEEEEEDGADEGEERSHAEKGRKLPVIPDRATIDAIRAKRAQLQQPRHSALDYISLDDGLMSGHPSAGGSSDEEENDFQGRVALFGGKMDGRPKKGVFESKEERVAVVEAKVVDGGYREVADDEDEDDEERKWEEEQFRKGLGRRIDEASTQRGFSSIPTIPPIQPQVSIYSGAALQSSMTNVSLGPTSIAVSQSAEVMAIPQQAEIATRALQENISKLKETHNMTLNSLVRTDTHLSEALSEITSLEGSLKSADEKYAFMQQLRDFISVMCDFLHDKAYFIEELEEQMQKLHGQQALAAVERRTFDIADEDNEVEAAVNAATSVLNKGTSAAYISAATTAAQAAAARESSSLSVELDEFGRDVNLKKRMEFTQRAEARKRRKIQSESKRMSSIGKGIALEQIEGEVSTDESDSESSAYESSRNELLRTAEQIFSDASEEYSNLKIVKERFERWKNQYSSTYRDAYVSLSAPAVFSPFVRLELLKWDPLYDTTDFFDMEWHKLLFNYGLPGKDNFDPDDADANLIPELVEKVALPILHHEIAHCWDMLSTQMTKNVVVATNMVINYVPASSKALHELLAVVRSRLTEAITGLSLPAWGTVVMNAVPGAAQLMAYRFGMSVRLLRNICLWKNILALPVLENLALEELLRGKLLSHVRSIMSNIHDAITRTERIVASLSGVWTGLEITIEPSQKLWPLVDCIAELGNKLEKRHASGVSKEDTRGLARRLKKMLAALHEYDKARAMLRTFQLKEAL